MPRVLTAKTTAPGSYPTAGVTVTFADCDPTNKNHFVLEGSDLLIARNMHASDACTVTINSQPNGRNRTKDITTESLAAGVYKIYGPFGNRNGWSADGYLQFEGSATDIEFAVIKTGAE